MFSPLLLFSILLLRDAAADTSLRDGFEVRVRGEADLPTLVSPVCFPPCDLDVCQYITPCPNQDIVAGGEKRAVGLVNGRSSGFELGENGTNLSILNTILHRQLFERVPNNPWQAKSWNRRNAAQYLPSQILPSTDHPAQEPQYNANARYLATVNPETEAAVSAFDAFGGQLTQIGSAGLHGCTIVTVISNRAVWSAHFWETYSMGPGMTEELTRWERQFEERVLDFIAGRPVPNPSNLEINQEDLDALKPKGGWPTDWRPSGRTYLPPQGPSLSGATLAHFTGQNDEPEVYIMTPIIIDFTEEGVTQNLGDKDPLMNRLRYPKRIRRISQTLQEQIPLIARDDRRPHVTVVGYAALDYRVPAQRAQANTNQRGIAMFQRDPNALGAGNPAWRLFYQQYIKTGRA